MESHTPLSPVGGRIPLASRGARPEHVQSRRRGAFWEPLGGLLEASWELLWASWGLLWASPPSFSDSVRICSREKAADQFDAAFFKMHKSVKDAACTECLDEIWKPLCQGGCGARPPDRLTYSTGFWCESCKFPPCARCGSTPRPKTAKYRVWTMKEWTCAPCRAQCRGLTCARCSAVFLREAVHSSQRDKADLLCPACWRAE